MGLRISKALSALMVRKNNPVLTPVHVAMALALTAGCIDLAVDMTTGESGAVPLPSIMASLAVTVALFFLLYLAAWYAVVARIGRSLKLDGMVLTISLALMMVVAFLFGAAQNLISFSLGKAELAKLLIVVALSTLLSALAYYVMRIIAEKPGSSKNAVLIGLVTPLLIAEYVIASAVVKGAAVAFVTLLAAACLTVLLLRRLGQAMQLRTLVVVFCLVPVMAVALAVVPSGASPSRQQFHLEEHKVKRVILLTVDSLRADSVSAYGNRDASTPHMDSLASDGVVFTSVTSPAPWTLPSLSSLMTGLSPEVHMTKGKSSRLPDNLQTLASHMRDSGYLTGAIVFNPYLKLSHGMSQGFEHYDVYPKTLIGNSLGAKVLKKVFARKFRERPTTSDLTNLAINWLKSNKGKDSFLWVHYLDPHMPYAPPEEFLPKEKAPPTIGTSFTRSSSDIRGGHYSPALSEREWIRKLYDGEVRYVDQNVGRLLDTLKKLDMYDDSLIILTADHGEEFWEHDSFEHGHTLYQELLHVPLIVKLPFSSSKGRIDNMVQTHSLMPTILDVCGMPRENEPFSTASLAPLLKDIPGTILERPAFSSGLLYYEDREALSFGGLKYIRSSISGREELYDLARDPREQLNIASLNPGPISLARDMVERHHAEEKRLRDRYQIEKSTEIVLDKKTLQEMKSLGYAK